MTTTAQSIIQRVQETVVDTAGNRFPASELVRDLNDMQRAIAAVRPDATAQRVDISAAEGYEQQIPATAACLLEITSRLSDGRAVRQGRREILDAIEPNWRAMEPTISTIHWMYDPRDPRRFEVYPPATVSAEPASGWRALVSAYPTDIAAPSGDGKAYTTVAGNISLADEFKNALYHLLCWRCYLKAAEFANAPDIAKAHLDMAVKDVGESLLARIGVGPGVAADATAAEPKA